ncbi:MAG: hypothetical protein NTZ02_01820 [Candidatus Woesearchaeota archaeon]|nr:hypothetical protein [Candidatus Woesearchaeota archaeon]
MRKFLMVKGKKGVSPLIATVLLIAFAVALGAVVMNWGKSFTTETINYAETSSATSVGCTLDVSLTAVQIGGNPQICYNESEHRIDFIVRNNGNRDIDDIELQVITITNESAYEVYENASILESVLKRGRVARSSWLWNTSISNNETRNETFEQVIITPMIKINGVNTPCPNQNLAEDALELETC